VAAFFAEQRVLRAIRYGTRIAMVPRRKGNNNMHSLKTNSLVLASSLAAFAVACGGGSPVSGTWNQANGSIAVPAALGGGTVSSNNTFVFDDSVSPATFSLQMDLSLMGLTDTLTAQGTYTDTGTAVTFEFTGFAIAAGSGDSSSIGVDGSQCITLNALAGAAVCFQTQQTDDYQVANNTLTIPIINEIVGGTLGPTTLTLTRSK
jgi:hypothetical protein